MSIQSGLTRAQIELWARLFLLEPDAETLEHLRQDARFAAALDEVNELRVEYTRLFALNVFPYASVYLDEQAAMHTETTTRVQAAYEQDSFEVDPRYPLGAPDHFGAELLFVSHCLERRDDHTANTFLNDEIIPWAGIFLHAVERAARVDFYRVLARAAREGLYARANRARHWSARSPREMPAAPLGQDDGLNQLVSLLVTPAHSGIFLSKEDIREIANALRVPISFGDRWLMLTSLFQEAGQYDRVESLLKALSATARAWADLFAGDEQAGITHGWRERADATHDRLEEMRGVLPTGGGLS